MSINPIATLMPREAATRRRASEMVDERHQTALTADLRALHKIAVRTHFSRGETIFGESDNSTHVYKVVSGVVRLCKYTLDGRRLIVDFMQAGNLFGFIKLEEYGFAAEAVTDVVLLSYPRNQIERLEATVPGVQRHVSALISESLLTMQQHLVVLGCQTAKERVASFLLRLGDRARLTVGERLSVFMGRQDIADHLGLTIETVCRALSELKRAHVIAIPNVHEVILSDMGALVDLADGGHCDEEPGHPGLTHDLSISRNSPRSFARNGSLLS